MPKYQKAYHLSELRKFPAWSESRYHPKPGGGTTDPSADPADAGPLNDETIVFIQENLSVSRSCFDESEIIFDAVTSDWKAFCRDVLKFAVPDWDAEAAEVRRQVTEAKGKPSPDERSRDASR